MAKNEIRLGPWRPFRRTGKEVGLLLVSLIITSQDPKHLGLKKSLINKMQTARFVCLRNSER